MKKLLFIIITFLIPVIYGCVKSEEYVDQENYEKKILGTWQLIYEEYFDRNGEIDWVRSNNLIFLENNTFIGVCGSHPKNDCDDSENVFLPYRIEGNKLYAMQKIYEYYEDNGVIKEVIKMVEACVIIERITEKEMVWSGDPEYFGEERTLTLYRIN